MHNKSILTVLARVLTFNIMCQINAQTPYSAIITVPVADLLGQSIITLYPHKNPIKLYEQLPLCGGSTRPDLACPRIHQSLFNEFVEVLEEVGDEVRICISNLYYKTSPQSMPQHTYWTLKKNITPSCVIPLSADHISAIPPAIDFRTSHKRLTPNIITLIMPWYDPITTQTYSAGTRFVFCKHDTENKNYTIVLYNPTNKNIVTTTIAQHYCLATHNKNPKECIQQFVHLLKQWTHIHHGFIPYVWGGCSFVSYYNQNIFTEQCTTHTPIATSCYVRTDDQTVQKTGLDCTGLIARAAQTCGMPYFLKNSTTIAQTLSPITPNKPVEEGDLIWIPGHVLIVSDLKRHRAIEARSYKHGFGKIHELPLNKIFKDIHTYKDLMLAFFEQKPLQRMNNQGIVIDIFPQFKILKMISIWQ